MDELITVAEASVRTGLTETAIKKRLNRHKMAGVKRDGRWYVVWNPEVAAEWAPRPDRPPLPMLSGPSDGVVAEVRLLRAELAEVRALLERPPWWRLALAHARVVVADWTLLRLRVAQRATPPAVDRGDIGRIGHEGASDG